MSASKYFVMERSCSAVAGAITIATKENKSEALKACKGNSNRYVLDSNQHDEWHKKGVMPYYIDS
jgi:hypothetical protein